MSNKIVGSVKYPFPLEDPFPKGAPFKAEVLSNCRGAIPSVQASRLRELYRQGFESPEKIVCSCLSYDGLSSRLVEEAGFPIVFLGGYAMAASAGLPDTGYIAFGEVVNKLQEVVRQVSIPVLVDGDTGYGSPLNVYRTVQGFAHAGAAGVMIEDQSWPKRKSVVERGEALARIKAAVDARNEGLDIWILARTDALIVSWEEAITRAKMFKEMGADAIFIEALPDEASIRRAVQEVQAPMLANIIQGGKTPNLPAAELAKLGYAGAAYPLTLPAAQLSSIRHALEDLKASWTVGPPPTIDPWDVVCEGVGFNKYWQMEEKYRHEGDHLVSPP